MTVSLKKVLRILFLFFILQISTGADSLRAEPAVHPSKGQTVYVPVYSHIYSGNREYPLDLTITMSIRNTDLKYGLTLERVDYYDSKGQLVKKHIVSPTALGPMSSTRYIVLEKDKTGGSGANFLVRWKSDSPMNPPLIESVMIGTRNQQGISFTSRGQVIEDWSEK